MAELHGAWRTGAESREESTDARHQARVGPGIQHLPTAAFRLRVASSTLTGWTASSHLQFSQMFFSPHSPFPVFSPEIWQPGGGAEAHAHLHQAAKREKQQPPRRALLRFGMMDQNQDGQISREEFAAAMRAPSAGGRASRSCSSRKGSTVVLVQSGLERPWLQQKQARQVGQVCCRLRCYAWRWIHCGADHHATHLRCSHASTRRDICSTHHAGASCDLCGSHAVRAIHGRHYTGASRDICGTCGPECTSDLCRTCHPGQGGGRRREKDRPWFCHGWCCYPKHH